MRRLFSALLILIAVCASLPSFAADTAPEYNLSRMRQMNPDFTTYPEAQGIIWLKRVNVSRSEDGGMQTTRLYVIRGRRGLGGRWLNWNIQTPENGRVEVLEANVYDALNGSQIGSVLPVEDSGSGIIRVNFSGVPNDFIIALSWREELPEQLSIEGLYFSQEELRVWESVLQVMSPQKLMYKTFPEREPPEVETLGSDTSYTWRKINLDPYNPSGELSRSHRSGVSFSTREGDAGLTGMIKSAESVGTVPEPAQVRKANALGMINWLSKQPEIILAEGSARKIPSSGEWTRREKILLAKSWLTSRKLNANIVWQLPFEPDISTPMSLALFNEPILELIENKGKNITFHDMIDSKLLTGARIYGFDNGRITPRRIPASKSADNRLSAIMNLNLDDNGMLSGNIRLILRGAWPALLLGNNAKPSDGVVRGALLSLFPGLTNYRDVKYTTSKGTPIITFFLDKKPGISGSGVRWLARPPFFEPSAIRALDKQEAPFEVKFPFIVDQDITINFPKNAKEALVSPNTARNPDKINYSDESRSKRRSFVTQARLELNLQTVTENNMVLLQKVLEQWRAFSARNIPVR
ncbi:MAG: hypothetical protein IJT58_08600 [Synergistaceae bacterium]|nr:hypothetical protein [Synergistaceae bacterium]